MRIVVDFPAPFGPIKAEDLAALYRKDTSSTATTDVNSFLRC